MGAREKLLAFTVLLPGDERNALAEAMADEILGDHARELAQRLLAENPDRCPEWTDGVEWAARLLDAGPR